jgi:hypothetical protein
MEAAHGARNSGRAPFGLQPDPSFWIDQRTPFSAARSLLPIEKGSIYPPRIVHRRRGE